MRTFRFLYFPALTAVLLGFATAAAAAVWDEATNGGGDAGNLPATAQAVQLPGTSIPVTRITGTLTLSNGVSEADVYKIYIASPASFSATTVSTPFVPGVNTFDTQLFLFNSAGLGIAANDDNPVTGTQQSTLSGGAISSLQAGTYYLLVTGSGLFPADVSLRNIFPNFTDGTTDLTTQFGPTGPGGASPFAAYTGSSNDGGNYSIALTGVMSLSAGGVGVQVTSVSQPSAGTVLIQGGGLVPGQQASVEASPDLIQAFTAIGVTSAADANGNVQFSDTPASGTTQRFYRLRPQ